MDGWTFVKNIFRYGGSEVSEGAAQAMIRGTVVSPAGLSPPLVLIRPQETGADLPSEVGTGTKLHLEAAAIDLGGRIVSYAWTATGGTFDNDDVRQVTWTAPSRVGTPVITVVVTDNDGLTGSAEVTIPLFTSSGQGDGDDPTEDDTEDDPDDDDTGQGDGDDPTEDDTEDDPDDDDTEDDPTPTDVPAIPTLLLFPAAALLAALGLRRRASKSV